MAKQVRCVHGTRDAGKLWEDTYTMVLEAMGFRTGVSNPCMFYRAERELMVVVHDDDFTMLGLDDVRESCPTLSPTLISALL